MVTPAVRASTTKRARKGEVFDKMTTVRGVGSSGANLKQAMAEVMSAGGEGRTALNKITTKLNSQQQNLRLSHKK